MTWPAPTIYTHEFFLHDREDAPRWGPAIDGCPGTGGDDAEWRRVVDIYKRERN